MAVIEGGTSASIAEVGAAAQKGLHVILKPNDVGALGAYRAANITGTLAAALGAGSATVGHMYHFRWPDATRFAVIHYVKAQFQTLTAFTAPTVTDFGFDMFKTTAHSVAGTTNKTNVTGSKMRTSMGATLMAAADQLIATTVGITGQTATFDTNAIAESIGDPNIVNAAAATEYANQGPPPILLYNPAASGEYPLTLAQNEGFIIRNRTVWPAAGTGLLTVEVAWSEVTAY